MKRTIFGLLAIVMATAAVAFTASTSERIPNSQIFYFTGSPLVQSDVADESKWSLTSPGEDCVGAANKACRIVVDDDQTETVNGVLKLKSTLNINAVAGAAGSGSGYVPDMPHTGIISRVSRP